LIGDRIIERAHPVLLSTLFAHDFRHASGHRFLAYPVESRVQAQGRADAAANSAGKLNSSTAAASVGTT